MVPQYFIRYLYIWYKTSKNSSHAFGKNIVQVTNLGSNWFVIGKFFGVSYDDIKSTEKVLLLSVHGY